MQCCGKHKRWRHNGHDRDKDVHLNRQPCHTSTTCLTSAWLDALATQMLKKRDRYRFCPCATKATTDNANSRLLECPRSFTTRNYNPTRKYGLPEGIEEKARDHPSCGAYFQSTANTNWANGFREQLCLMKGWNAAASYQNLIRSHL
jgi:hypothetical protein